MRRHRVAGFLCVVALGTSLDAAAQLRVVGTAPQPRALQAPADGAIRIRFDRPVLRESVVARRSFWAFGRWSGAADGEFRFSEGDRVVELVRARPFSAGEMVTVFVSHDLAAADGTRLRAGGYSFQFWVRAGAAAMDFTMIGRQTTRGPADSGTRPYGGVATDLDGDGHLDISLVNEDSDDLRVFLNDGDGTGSFSGFLTPPTPTGDQPSPSEPGDFNADGRADIAVANFGNGISILLGRGDGRFRSQQLVATPGLPRSLALLDADGDGDVDVTHTNRSNTLSLLLNDGDGRFGAGSTIPGGGEIEWALGAADMNGDGLLDLVTGDRGTERIYVYAASGDGSFDLVSQQPSGGRTWMLVLGDVDGDGFEDVAAVNGDSDSAAILRGTGDGRLESPRVISHQGFPLASDLGDLDGDGDLDWVTSSFEGAWRILRNDGEGSFTVSQEILAVSAAACALMLDVDGDGDLDLVLIDEVADEMIVLRNGS